MNKISYIKNVKVIDDGIKKIVLKRESSDVEEIYQLLDNRKFEYYLFHLLLKKCLVIPNSFWLYQIKNEGINFPLNNFDKFD